MAEKVRTLLKTIGHDAVKAIVDGAPENAWRYYVGQDPKAPNKTDGFYMAKKEINGFAHQDWQPYTELEYYFVSELRNALVGNRFKVGQTVAFDQEKHCRWTVRAVREEFAILTAWQFGELRYTIVDVIEGVRGPDNMIFDQGYETDEQIEHALNRLFGNVGDDIQMEISHRYRIRLVVREVRGDAHALLFSYTPERLKSVVDGVPDEAKWFVDDYSVDLQCQGFCTDKKTSHYKRTDFYPIEDVRAVVGLGA